MNVLAIDTATAFLCIGLSDGVKNYLTRLEVGTGLSSMLVKTIRGHLDAVGWKAADIDCFACGSGPGSFTALRIGMAAIKAMAWATHKPVAGIPSLDILAYALRGEESVLVPVMDAKRSMVYTAAYAAGSGVLRRITPYQLVPVGEFSAVMGRKICSRRQKRIIITGDAADLVRPALSGSLLRAEAAEKDFRNPSPHALLELAQQACARKQTCDAFKLKPLYLYPQECQIRK